MVTTALPEKDLNVIAVSQESVTAKKRRNDCGIACAVQCIHYWTKVLLTVDSLVPESELAYQDNGMSVNGVIALMAKHNVVSHRYYATSIDDLKHFIDLDCPVIALIRYGDITERQNKADYYGNHFVVIRGYSGDKVILNDPDFWGASEKIGDDLTIPAVELWKAMRNSNAPCLCIVTDNANQTIPASTEFSDTLFDIYHGDPVTSFALAKAQGMIGVILKATQGLYYNDPTYADRVVTARNTGLGTAAYHFGVGSNAIAQADHFLATVKPFNETNLVLDYESNPLGADMSQNDAEKFVTRIHDVTGKWPILYTEKWYIAQSRDTVLSNCDLWIAGYNRSPLMPRQWAYWKLWQYTNGTDGINPIPVNGVGKCDRSKFRGTDEQLKVYLGLLPKPA